MQTGVASDSNFDWDVGVPRPLFEVKRWPSSDERIGIEESVESEDIGTLC